MRLSFTYLSLTVLTVLSLTVLTAPTAQLVDTGAVKGLGETCAKSGLCPDVKTASSAEASREELAKLVGNIIQTLLGLTAVIFLFFIIGAGSEWISAGGNSEKVSNAVAIIKSAIYGFIVILSAYIITNFLTNIVITWVTST